MPRAGSPATGTARNVSGMLQVAVGQTAKLCQPRMEANGESCQGEQPGCFARPRKGIDLYGVSVSRSQLVRCFVFIWMLTASGLAESRAKQAGRSAAVTG